MRNFIRFVFLLSLSFPNARAASDAAAYRARIRSWVISHSHRALFAAEPLRNDSATALMDELRYTSLAEMESAGMLSARLEDAPWSGSYWPVYAGEIAYRYGDERYSPTLIWKDNARYLENAVGSGTGDELSPAEKYDLLVGDEDFTLTRKMINAGAPYADREGSVPSWFGICHGWAPASFMEARPERSVTAKTADGKKIKFYPADLKALASLLWTNGADETRFISGRCNNENPPRDGDHRETDPDCFDTNPATWHLSVVNQIGVAKRSFVVDVSAGAEVWNQPAVGYQYSYVNPATGAAAKTLAEGKIRLADWREDPYSAHRSRKAVYVVKVTMYFEYAAETQPVVSSVDRADMDAHANKVFTYDLELDENDVIVGGEWYSAAHPDFLWLPVKGSKASSEGDAALDLRGDHSAWNPSSPIPKSWRAAAKSSSANEQPLARVVERLLELSHTGR